MQEGFRRDVQGLRAVAVLLVVAYHSGIDIPGGFVGVDVFFVISGFVITKLLVTEMAGTDRLGFGRFYARRVRRILPALAAMLVIVAVLAFGALSPLKPKQTTARTGIAAATFTANVYLYRSPRGYFDIGTNSNPFLHTWSLSVEEQFYLVFPATIAIAWGIGRRRRIGRGVTVATLAVLGAASFALCVATSRGVILGPRFAFYMAPTRAWEFCVGALLVFAPWRRSPRALREGLALAGALAVLVGAFTIHEGGAFPGTEALWPVIGTALVIAAGGMGTTLVGRALSARPMTATGNLSYSWYLWHWPCIVFATAVWPDRNGAALAAGVASLLPALASYRWLEQPLRADRRIRGRRALAVAGVCIAVPVLACAALGRFRIAAPTAASRARLAALRLRHADELRGCDSPARLAYEVPGCTWGEGRRGDVVLVGDSNAGQFTEPVRQAALASGRRFVVSTDHGCRFVDVDVARAGGVDHRCRRHVEATVRTLRAHRPGLVIIASSSPEIVTPSNVGLVDPATGTVTHDRTRKVAIWRAGAERVLAPLRDAGIPVVLVDTIPQFPGWDANCAAVRVYLAPASCGLTASRSSVERFRAPARRAEHAAARATGTTAVDFSDLMCDRAVCRTNLGDRWIYRDGEHLSVRASLDLSPRFRKIIEQHAASSSPA